MDSMYTYYMYIDLYGGGGGGGGGPCVVCIPYHLFELYDSMRTSQRALDAIITSPLRPNDVTDVIIAS